MNSGDRFVIPEIALYHDGSGQRLLLVFASLCETKWMHRLLMAQTSHRARSTGRNPSPTSPRPLSRPRLRISLQWAGRRCPQHLLWNAGGIPHLTITNSRKGRGARSFDTLRSLRLCVRLYWRSVSTGHDREIAPTGGCPSPMLRMVPLFKILRN